MTAYIQEEHNVKPVLGDADPEGSVSPEQLYKKKQKDIRRASMNMLARREHSLKELERKLIVKFPLDKKHIVKALCQLKDEGLQSDQRFSEGYFRWRSNKGFGPDRITMELKQKGVDDDTIDQAINAVEIDWYDLLKKQYQKKYQSLPPETLEEKAKYTRFFLYRGFSHAHINTILKY